MDKERISTVALLWDIRYRESGEGKFKIQEDFFWKALQDFVRDKEVSSITFHANGFTNSVGHISHETRIYEEQSSKDEFLQVNQTWIEDRKKEIGIA